MKKLQQRLIESSKMSNFPKKPSPGFASGGKKTEKNLGTGLQSRFKTLNPGARMMPMHGEYKYLIEGQHYTCLRRSSQPTLPASGVHPAPNPIARQELQELQASQRSLSHPAPLPPKFLEKPTRAQSSRLQTLLTRCLVSEPQMGV
jgi:hypothetical protein